MPSQAGAWEGGEDRLKRIIIMPSHVVWRQISRRIFDLVLALH